MKIVVDIGHPAHVHFFKNFIWEMKRRGHKILITTKEKDVTTKLLENFGFKYVKLGSNENSLIKKIINIPIIDLKMFKVVKGFAPDIFIGLASHRTARISKLFRKPSIIFNDTDHSLHTHLLYLPFTDLVLTPSCFRKDFGKKQFRYNGYHELAYLHPKYFKPNSSVLDDLAINKDDKYAVIRFVAWSASHDIGQTGLSLEVKKKTVEVLLKYIKIFISSEEELPNELREYQIKIQPEKMHDALAFATLSISEGATMTSECAVLGTPAIYVNSLELGYCTEQEYKYGLVFGYRNSKGVLDKALELLNTPNLKQEWQKRREKMLSEKIDVSAFMVWFIENYPESAKITKENPEYQLNFK